MGKFKLEKIGDWAKAMQAAERVASLMKEAQQKLIEKFGIEALRLIKGHIEQQDLPWKPLSKNYLNAKERHGDSMNTWQRTKQLYDSLEYDTGENFAIIGIMSGQVNDNGDDLPMIAAIHEFGALSVGIYERPLFRPTMEEMMSWLESQDIGKEVLDQLHGL